MATSPPAHFPLSITNTKKRPSISSSVSAQSASKRPKLHPLRQTTFPLALDTANISAISETGSVSNSLLSAKSAKVPGRGRGRPRKSATLNEDDFRTSQAAARDSSSLVDGSVKASGRGTKSAVSAGGDADDDDEGDIDGMLENLDEQDRKQAEEEEARQEQRRDRLTDTFDSDQYNRYSQWRALTLNKQQLKKMVNSIVSQSVTQAPLQAINIYGKFFVGEIVERARDVQIEYANAYDITREQEIHVLKEDRRKLQNALDESLAKLSAGVIKSLDVRESRKELARLNKRLDTYIPNPHRGGLLPDHLREALRRYKMDGEGGGVGFEGTSHGLLGVHGSSTWRVADGSTGKRLFR